MIKHGQSPYLECSSHGDKRFSAFFARIRSRGLRSVEEMYQSAKKFSDGSTGLHWREAKGKPAINQVEVAEFYEKLWREYIDENPQLKQILINASGLSDIFGQAGHVCQATTLWKIRNELTEKRN